MRALMIYDSRYGNTEQVARAITGGLRTAMEVDVRRASGIGDALTGPPPDLLLVGGPTQLHGLSATLRGCLQALPREALAGVPVATFDTRYRMSALVSGSAARQAAGRLREAGCHLVVEPESFFIDQDRPPEGVKRRRELEHPETGELDRAAAWGRQLARQPANGEAR